MISWKRTKNEQNVPVPFGYCEFETIEGVLRCMRLMNGMFLYGKSLEVKFSEKTQLFIRDFYEIKKKELMSESTLDSPSARQRQRPHRKRSQRRTHGAAD